MSFSVDHVQKPCKQKRGELGKRAAKHQGTAGLLNAARHAEGEQIHGRADFHGLLKHLRGGVLIGAANRRKVSAKCRGERDEGQGDAKQTKRDDGASVFEPDRSDRLGKCNQQYRSTHAKRQCVEYGTKHGGADAFGLLFSDRVNHHVRHPKVDSRGGKREGKAVNARHEGEKPHCLGSHAVRDKDLKGHADRAHE